MNENISTEVVNNYVENGKENDGSLCQLMNNLGSDKCALYNYPDYYDLFLKPIKNRHLKILEIGLGSQTGPYKSQMNKTYLKGSFPV